MSLRLFIFSLLFCFLPVLPTELGALILSPNCIQTNANVEASLDRFSNQGHSYDNNGNNTGAGSYTYGYDFLNRLTSRTGGTSITLVYDGDGNRVKKTKGSTTTYYLIDDLNPTGYSQTIEERSTQTGSPVVSYIYGLDLMSQKRGSTTHYFGYDGHGSVRYLTSSSGSITDTYSYDSFGIQIASTGSTVNNYRYSGEHWDSDLGLYYFRARWYDPNLGRFMSMDTFEGNQKEPLSLHKYAYTHNNPVNMVDPSGHFFTAIGGVMSGGIQTSLRTSRSGTILIAKKKAQNKLIRSLAAPLLLAMAVFDTGELTNSGEDNLSFVVRGGIANSSQLQRGVALHFEVPGLTGFSVQSEPDKTIDELAQAGQFPNKQISVSSVKSLKIAAMAVGYLIEVVKSPGRGYHKTVATPMPLSARLADALSSAFESMPNPHPFN